MFVLLSPLAPELLKNQAVIPLAEGLRAQGAKRADVSTFPRYGYRQETSHKGIALPNFTMAARSLADLVLRPVIGASDVYDLHCSPKIDPTLPTLSHVGAIFASKTLQGNKWIDLMDGGDLGLVFHVALHGKSADRKPYDHMVFPTLSARGHKTLLTLGDNLIARAPGQYGSVINLLRLRKFMAAVYAAH